MIIKAPVVDTVGRSYRFVVENAGRIFLVSAIPIGLLVAFDYFFNRGQIE